MIWFIMPWHLLVEIKHEEVPQYHYRIHKPIPELQSWLDEHAPGYNLGKVANTYVLGVEQEETAALLKLSWNLK